jgi:hypothetical protein
LTYLRDLCAAAVIPDSPRPFPDLSLLFILDLPFKEGRLFEWLVSTCVQIASCSERGQLFRNKSLLQNNELISKQPTHFEMAH